MTSITKRFMLPATMVPLIAWTNHASAGIILENPDQPVFGGANVFSDLYRAVEYTAGGQNYHLDSLVARLGTYNNATTPNAFAELVADDGGTPGSTVLTSFAFPSPTMGQAN